MSGGIDKDMVRIPDCRLHVFDGAAAKAEAAVMMMREGELRVHILKQTTSPVALTVFMVGTHHWPAAKDAPAVRVGPRRFAFGLPGVLYGLELPEGCEEGVVGMVEGLLLRFCTYEDHSFDQEFKDLDQATDEFWATAASEIAHVTAAILDSVAARSGTMTSPPSTTDANQLSLRAIRLSAATKVVARAVLSGFVGPRAHIEFLGPAADTPGPRAVFPSVLAFSDYVESVERVLGGVGQRAPLERWSLARGIGYWRFNRTGLALLLGSILSDGAEAARAAKKARAGAAPPSNAEENVKA
ncbi:hypothetical protein QJS10_CPA09g00483 [Acorus calamus]|uniref:Uncharacterized protein n=1 Tax=Acorus calamus TaxID=4465 RepID=A0AAV9E7Y1_ACOCL|nr:hypothetical protein QJS10_CPA09g00483 [Acorus calamus]